MSRGLQLLEMPAFWPLISLAPILQGVDSAELPMKYHGVLISWPFLARPFSAAIVR